METTSTNDRKPTAAFWAMLAAIAAFVYLLSFGPAVWLLDRRVLPTWTSQPASIVYAPIFHLSLAGPRPVREALRWYADLGSKPIHEPIFDYDGLDR